MALRLLQEGTEHDVPEAELRGVEAPDPDVIYRLRKISPARNKAVIKAHTDDRRRGGAQVVDQLAVIDDLVDYALTAWTGVVDGEGAPAPCTRENKLAGLDYTRKSGIVEFAMSMDRARTEDRAASFREPARMV